MMAQQIPIEPIKRSVAKISGEPSKKPKRQVQQERGRAHYVVSGVPLSYEFIGWVW